MKILQRLIHPELWGAVAIVLSIALVACSDTPDDASAAIQPATEAVAAPAAIAPPIPTATAELQATPTTERKTAARKIEATVAPQDSPTAVVDTPAPANSETERLSTKGMELLTRLTEEYSPRESGTDEERAAAEFIGGYLYDIGYRVQYQAIEVEHIPRDGEFVSLIGDDKPALIAAPLSMTAMGDVTAPLVSVGSAFEDDIPKSGLQGAIALIERGQITFEEKVNRVADAGALAAIIYNNKRGNFRGSLQSDGPIPAASLSREQGEQVLRLLEDDPELQARVNIESVLLDSQNVIAEPNNQTDECGVVVLGAHYDSVADTEAAGDNGTGIASLLTMAEDLARARHDDEQPLPYAVRLIFFGVEEIGLYGSIHYVDSLSEEERENVIAMLNFDAMGKGNASVVGSADLVSKAVEYAEANGIGLNGGEQPSGFGSDHAPFLAAGIPALFFFGDDFSAINSPDDLLEEVEPELMGANMAVGLGMLNGFECKPKK